tara:strand:+ start:3913 stop:4590 length:678 start_codon:yes stop_codon:yes gene_type:complete
MDDILKSLLDPILDEEGKVIVPEYASNVKIDVGLSHCAPNARLWIDKLKDRHVFCFEPQTNLDPLRGVDPNRYTLLRCGLDDAEKGSVKDMYICGQDCGRSSMYKPNTFDPVQVTSFMFIPFVEFLKRFPWDRFSYIEHLKTDTQGNDLKILQNAGDYLKKVVYLEVEATCYENEYEYYPEKKETQDYLESMGFELIEETNAIDQTYVNTAYKDIATQLDFSRVA